MTTTKRQGKPTNHIQFDEATAILAGDALLTLAFEILATELSSAEVAAACCADLAGAAGMCGMVGGQMADLLAESGEGRDSDRKISPHPSPPSPLNRQLSTHGKHPSTQNGASAVRCLTMGRSVQAQNPQTLRSLTTYGEAIGLAFQIADDLLDVCGDSETMGKRVERTQIPENSLIRLCWEAEAVLRAEQLVCDACQAVAIFGSRGQRKLGPWLTTSLRETADEIELLRSLGTRRRSGPSLTNNF
ncbi:MAG: polyprenyl synthetase family protein [Planctomycetaceae bacterium]